MYSPLEALFPLLIFILSKELHATPLQLTVLAASKPVVSLFAFQLSALLAGNSRLFRPFLMGMTLLSALPCLFFPVIGNNWFYIVSYALFMTTLRASVPAWIELLKCHAGLRKMSGIAATGSAINYAIMMALPVLLGFWMDHYPEVWKFAFFAFGLLLLLNLFVLSFLKTEGARKIKIQPLLSTWKEGWQLIRKRPDFAHYQVLFFLGGAGLVALQPILPIYFNESLHLSYTQLTVAFSLCKGLAFVASSPFWAKWAKNISLYKLNAAVNILSTLFVACILAAMEGEPWLWLAYLFYGAMQAGCEMSWNLSPPTFSQDKESTIYASINLFFVGLRGCICPFLGQAIFLYSGSFAVLDLAATACLLSVFYAWFLDKKDLRNATDKCSTIS